MREAPCCCGGRSAAPDRVGGARIHLWTAGEYHLTTSEDSQLTSFTGSSLAFRSLAGGEEGGRPSVTLGVEKSRPGRTVSRKFGHGNDLYPDRQME